MLQKTIFDILIMWILALLATIVRELRTKGKTRKGYRRSAGKWLGSILMGTMIAVAVYCVYVWKDLDPMLGFLLSMIGGLCAPEIIDLTIDIAPKLARKKLGIKEDAETADEEEK